MGLPNQALQRTAAIGRAPVRSRWRLPLNADTLGSPADARPDRVRRHLAAAIPKLAASPIRRDFPQ